MTNIGKGMLYFIKQDLMTL